MNWLKPVAEQGRKSSTIDLLLFDLDGTLIDSVPQLHLAVDGALQACGLPGATLEQVKQWIGNGADMLLRRAMTHSYEVQNDIDEVGEEFHVDPGARKNAIVLEAGVPRI